MDGWDGWMRYVYTIYSIDHSCLFQADLFILLQWTTRENENESPNEWNICIYRYIQNGWQDARNREQDQLKRRRTELSRSRYQERTLLLLKTLAAKYFKLLYCIDFCCYFIAMIFHCCFDCCASKIDHAKYKDKSLTCKNSMEFLRTAYFLDFILFFVSS